MCEENDEEIGDQMKTRVRDQMKTRVGNQNKRREEQEHGIPTLTTTEPLSSPN